MRVLIINTNRERSPHTLVPLGACLVASAARSAGHDVRFLDLTFERHAARAAASAVDGFQPHVVGLSVRNIDNCDFSSPRPLLATARRVAAACRSAGARTIVVGGAAVTTAPGAVIEYLRADYGIVGEGESSFPELLRVWESGGDPLYVPGVARALDEWTVASSPKAISDLSAIPSDSVGDWLNIGSYLRYDSAMPVQTKRGCQFHCSYCLYPTLEGEGVRLRDPEMVASEVSRASALGFRSVEFVDSIFNVPESHAVACCEAIARLPASVPLQTLELSPFGCSRDLVQSMNAAGFTAVGCTAESGSDAMLQSLGKGYSSEDIRRAAANLAHLRAVRLWIFMLGGPGECEATVSETARLIESTFTPHDIVYVSCGIRILPETGLHRRAVMEGVVDPGDDLIRPSFYFSDLITPSRAMEIIYKSGFPTENIIRLGDGNSRFLPVAQRVGRMVGLAPPYWRLAPIWNRARHPVRRS